MPFRSEEVQAREQLRRAEEQVTELLDERAVLERQAVAQRRPRAWLIGFLAAVLVATAGGSVAGTLAASARAERSNELRKRSEAESSDREGARLLECRAHQSRTEASLAFCQHLLRVRP